MTLKNFIADCIIGTSVIAIWATVIGLMAVKWWL